MQTSSTPAGSLARIRRLLLATLWLAIPGTAAELLLLGHYDGWKQLIPLAAMALAMLVLLWHVVDRTHRPLRTFQAVMGLFVISGALGIVLHYQGNVEFELEMYPSTAGLELFRKAMTGATPALAPGTMVVLGLMGLAYTIGHPRLMTPMDNAQERL